MADWHPIYVGVRAAFTADTGTGNISTIAPSTSWFADQVPDRKPDTNVYLVYRLIGEFPHQRLVSGDNIDGELQVDAYGNRQDETTVKSLADAAYRLLNRVNLTVAGFSNVATMGVQKPRPFKENPYFRLMSRIKLYGTAA